MYGAILGDIIGSPYEFGRGDKTKDFPLFSDESKYTDDTVMTLAVARAFMADPAAGDSELFDAVSDSMRELASRYPYAGYGTRFSYWLGSRRPEPYGSFGNGSAMRVSAVAWLYEDIDSVRRAARLSALPTHDHPEGIKGAEAVACAIFMARNGADKQEIKAFTEENFGYDLSRSCDEIRPGYRHVESCMETVPEAFAAFLEAEDFEDCLRNAVSLGGDADTLAAIAGSIAEAFFGVPEELKQRCRDSLPLLLRDILLRFDERLGRA